MLYGPIFGMYGGVKSERLSRQRLNAPGTSGRGRETIQGAWGTSRCYDTMIPLAATELRYRTGMLVFQDRYFHTILTTAVSPVELSQPQQYSSSDHWRSSLRQQRWCSASGNTSGMKR